MPFQRMHIRPRCSEWLPLVTQQMRLRSLMRIEAFNIVHNNNGGDTFIYYTLHYNKDEIAFYVSEVLPLRHTHLKWAEINCQEMLKSNSNCVCVKVWAQSKNEQDNEIETMTATTTSKEPISILTKELSRINLSPKNLTRPPDKLLFTWGVYFSGLILFNMDADNVHFLPNTLIFEINANYFAAPNFLMPASLRSQLSRNSKRIEPYLPKYMTTETSDNNSCINSPHASPRSSPTHGNSLTNSTHWQDLLEMSHQHYEFLNLPASKVRPSYTLKQLLRLQEIQRLRQHTLKATEDIIEEIKELSVHCITTEQLERKPRRISSSNSKQRNTMGRTLSVLLAEEQQLDPQAMLRAQTLQVQLETLHARQQLLLAERDTCVQRNLKLQQKLQTLRTSKQEFIDWMAKRQAQLLQGSEELLVQKQLVDMHQHMRRCMMQRLDTRMSALCLELREIYPIVLNECGFYTIAGVALPNMELYMNDAKYAHSLSMLHVPPMALSAGLGYLAHLVQIISIIINRPLRNPITHEGSRSRIMDIIKEIPESSRAFPLFSRSAIPSKAVKYAIYLLNQNIAQLCFDITGIRCDLRATIDNLMRIFAEYEESQRTPEDQIDATQIHSQTLAKTNWRRMRPTLLNHKLNNGNVEPVAGDNGTNKDKHMSSACNETLSKSHSSVDMNFVPMTVPMQTHETAKLLQLPSNEPILEHGQSAFTQRRVCRSVGSYSDCEEENFNEYMDQSYSNSDSNLIFRRENS